MNTTKGKNEADVTVIFYRTYTKKLQKFTHVFGVVGQLQGTKDAHYLVKYRVNGKDMAARIPMNDAYINNIFKE